MHHANIILSEKNCRSSISDFLIENLNFDVNANPDFLLVESQPFGIDDARSLEKWAIGRPLFGKTKVSLIITNSITFEAQNALLKVLEEPPAGTYIFINLENLSNLLPTFISRIMVLDIFVKPSEVKESLENIGQKFLNSKIKDRLLLVRSLSKKNDKNQIKELIKNLDKISYENFLGNTDVDLLKAQKAKNILIAKIFASVRGSSPKMLLEWLSVVL